VLKYSIESAVTRVHAGIDVELGCWVLFKSDKEEINKDSTGYKEAMLQSSKKGIRIYCDYTVVFGNNSL